MCELMTIAAAIPFTALAAFARRAGRPARALGTTALGQAAGTAAALARKAGVLPPDVDPNELRAALRRDGAFVG